MESDWEAKLREFVRRTGEELRRTGEELKKTSEELRDEAVRVFQEVRTPQNQEKVRQSMREVSEWAKKTADDASVMLQQVAARAESAMKSAADKVNDKVGKGERRKDAGGWVPPLDEEQDAPAKAEGARPTPKGAAKKGAARKGKPAGEAAKKTIGKKRR